MTVNKGVNMYKVKEKVLNKILNYLAGKPYLEVRDLIAEIQQSEKIEEEKKEE